MKVSAIIPVYNGGRHIAQAIQSMRRQEFPDLEIIVVDDGSTDDTARVVNGFSGVRYEYQKNQGPGAARNLGLSLAAGDVIAFCDADDRWTDDKLAIQLAMLEEPTRPGVVIGYCQTARACCKCGPYEKVGEPVFYLMLGNALIRRGLFAEIGVFAERLPSEARGLSGQYGEDLDWYLRAKEAGVPIRFHREVVLLYFRHDQNLTLDRNAVALSTVREMKRSLDRRRLAGERIAMMDWSRETSFE